MEWVSSEKLAKSETLHEPCLWFGTQQMRNDPADISAFNAWLRKEGLECNTPSFMTAMEGKVNGSVCNQARKDYSSATNQFGELFGSFLDFYSPLGGQEGFENDPEP